MAANVEVDEREFRYKSQSYINFRSEFVIEIVFCQPTYQRRTVGIFGNSKQAKGPIVSGWKK